MFKILTLNTWQERGPWKLRWELILKGIQSLEPDVIAFQEVFNPDWAREVKKKSGYPFLVFHPERSGLMFLSQHTVVESLCHTFAEKSPTEDYSRYALFAEIKIGKKKINFLNTHLSWKPEEYATRERQISELLKFMKFRESENKSESSVLVGDFNAPPSAPEIQRFIKEAKVTDAFAALFPDVKGFTWNNENPYIRNCSHPMPDRRIDYVFFKNVENHLGPLEKAELVLNRPTSTGIWPSDHFGLLASFNERKL